MRKSKVLERLRADKPVLMTNISLGANTVAIEMAGLMGCHAVWMDMEHRSFTWREIESMIMAARLGDTDAVVRVRKHEGYATFMRPFQEGAAGIIVPHVRSGDEAAQWVEYAKYPPVGRRGLENMMRDADMGLAGTGAYIEHANRETFLALQIEDADAVDAAEEILAVPGYEIVFLGPGDLSNGYGVAGQLRHPRVMAAIEKVAGYAEKHGKWWGLPVMDGEDAARMANMGGRFFNFSGDYGWIRGGLEQIRDDFTKYLEK